jgi:hypothetical protein
MWFILTWPCFLVPETIRKRTPFLHIFKHKIRDDDFSNAKYVIEEFGGGGGCALRQNSHPTILYLRSRMDYLWITRSVQIKVQNAPSLIPVWCVNWQDGSNSLSNEVSYPSSCVIMTGSDTSNKTLAETHYSHSSPDQWSRSPGLLYPLV